MTSVTNQLLLVLAIAALLGMVIGAAIVSIRGVAAAKRHALTTEGSVEQLQNQLADVRGQYTSLQRAGEAEKRLASIAKNKEHQSTAQQDALQVHSRLQAQRISSLEASLSAAEERGLRLQRDFESFRAHKQQELDNSRRPDAVAHAAAFGDTNLPVLNKRVIAGGAMDTVSSDDMLAIQAMLDKDLAIPELPESELQGSVNDIDFEELLEDLVDPVG